jgi:hypothetical protein
LRKISSLLSHENVCEICTVDGEKCRTLQTAEILLCNCEYPSYNADEDENDRIVKGTYVDRHGRNDRACTEDKDDIEDKKDDDKDDDDDDKKKFSLLEESFNNLSEKYNDLSEKYSLLEKDYQTLVSFKADVEDKKKDDLISSFYMLSEADKADVIANKSKYSYDEIEAKLSVMCVRKKVNFTENEEKADNPEVTFNLVETEKVPAFINALRNTKKERQ